MIGDIRRRAAGEPILLVIAVHEFIHACGLDNGYHMNLSNLFVYRPKASEQTEQHPVGDADD